MAHARGIVWALLPVLVLGSVTATSAVVLLVVIAMLTLFSAVGLSFVYYADVRAVAVPADESAACEIAIEILDEQGQMVDKRQARVAAGETLALQYRSRAARGETDTIRAVVKSWTVPPRPLPPGPCPVLASLQLVDARTGQTVGIMIPVSQRTSREVIEVP
jgi:hypothetical protein